MQEWEMTPEQIKEKLDNMVWSFSRINSADQCMYAWYLSYIEEQKGVENAYAQFGTLCHETLEKYLKGELDMFTVAQYYEDHYRDYVTCDFPSNKYVDLGEKQYLGGKQYFENINFDFDKYEVLGVEQELKFYVGKYPFHGYADAIYKDKETGEIILQDHKTSSFKYKVDGSISKTNQKVFDHYVKQEYLYCIPLIEQYGKVDWLTWNMIRDQREIKIPFNQEDYEKTIEWAINIIETIKNEAMWLPDTSNNYFCNVLCSNRSSCYYHQ